MRKLNKLTTLIISVLVIGLAFSCSSSPISHEHKFSKDWSSDENTHWHKCTVEGCIVKSEEGKHIAGDWTVLEKETTSVVKKCTVCDYVLETKTSVTLVSTKEGLKAALTDDTAKEIVLVADINDLAETIDIAKDVTLDLNNKIIKSDARAFLIKKGTVTIKNGTIETTIKTENGSYDAGKSVIRMTSESGESKLVIASDATIKATNCYGITAFDKNATNKTSIDIYGTIESANPCLASQGHNDYASFSANLTMTVHEGATLIADTSSLTSDKVTKDPVAIYQPGPSNLVIEGGTITSKDGSAVEIRAGKATISGGKLVSNASTYSVKANGAGPTVIGAALAVSQHTTKKDIDVQVTGGTFEGVKQLAVVDTLNDASGAVKVTVKDVVLDSSKIVGTAGDNGTYTPVKVQQ